jgi:predicted peptidase
MITTVAVLAALELFAMLAPDVEQLYEAREMTLSAPGGEQKFVYRLLKPEKIEPGKKYPVVLFLHGAGERGNDNKLQLKYLPTWLASDENRQKFPCFVLAPQCPNGQKWSDVDWGAKGSIPMKDVTPAMQAAVMQLDKLIQEEPVDAKRVYLTGLSMGGYGSWDLAERTPERFAALAPICGGGDDSRADRLVKVPVWAWHGDADTAVPVERSRKMIEAIKAAGGNPKYTELKGVGHDSWTKAYTDPEGVVPWMFEQKLP